MTGSAALPLPFGSTQTTGNYTVTPNVIFLWDPPLLLDFCVRSSRAFVTASGTLPFVQGVAIGSAGFALGRICLMLGVTIDDVTNRRTAYFNISSNLIGLDNCYLQAGSPLTGAGLGGVFPALFPSQVRLNNYQFTDTNAIKSCPLPRANDMPAELLGSAATQGSIVPWALFNGIPPALVSGQTALATDGVYQEFLSTSIVMNYCLYSVTRLTVTAPQGTATPPGAPAPSSARGATFGWWSVRFGDRALYPTQSICALFARVPSATIPGADDLVYGACAGDSQRRGGEPPARARAARTSLYAPPYPSPLATQSWANQDFQCARRRGTAPRAPTTARTSASIRRRGARPGAQTARRRAASRSRGGCYS